jgi:hypothetical protein
LKHALGDLQYSVQDHWSVVAGSQDIQQWMAMGPGGQLSIKSKTYVAFPLKTTVVDRRPSNRVQTKTFEGPQWFGRG